MPPHDPSDNSLAAGWGQFDPTATSRAYVPPPTHVTPFSTETKVMTAAPAPTYGPLICQRPGYTWVDAIVGMPAHWERERAGSTTPARPGPADPVTGVCGTSETRVHASGEVPGVSVAPTNSFSLGPWTIPIPRPGNKYSWLLDDYSKLTPDVAAIIGKQLQTPIQSGWKTPFQPGFWKGEPQPTWLTEPGTTASFTYPNGLIETVTWPARASWGEYLTYEGWARRLGFWGKVIDAGYFGGLGDPLLCGGRSAYACSTVGETSDDRVAPIARFKHPTNGEDWGLWISIDPVGDPILSTAHTRSDGAALPPRERRSMVLRFTVQKIPSAPWYSSFLQKLFYIPIMLGKGWYDLVCGNPAEASAASASNPYAAAAVKATSLLCQVNPGAAPPPLPLLPVIETPVAPEPFVPPPITSIAPKYQGCVSRFHKSKHTFSVYCPTNWRASVTGLGGVDLFGQAVTPAPPAGTIKVADEPVAPQEAPNVGTEDDPLYKKWWFWTIVGGVVVAGSVGGVVLVRRRRRRA